MSLENPHIAELWTDIRTHVDALDHDVAKNARGVVAAGTRARKGLRQLKRLASQLTKLMIVLDKETKTAKKAV